MKKIEAIIRPHKLEEVREALGKTVKGMTVMEAKGFGRQKGHTEIYRGSEYRVHFLPKIQLFIVCEDDEVENIVQIIQEKAHTGKMGDGKIFIYSVEESMRVRTGEKGTGAL